MKNRIRADSRRFYLNSPVVTCSKAATRSREPPSHMTTSDPVRFHVLLLLLFYFYSVLPLPLPFPTANSHGQTPSISPACRRQSLLLSCTVRDATSEPDLCSLCPNLTRAEDDTLPADGPGYSIQGKGSLNRAMSSLPSSTVLGEVRWYRMWCDI